MQGTPRVPRALCARVCAFARVRASMFCELCDVAWRQCPWINVKSIENKQSSTQQTHLIKQAGYPEGTPRSLCARLRVRASAGLDVLRVGRRRLTPMPLNQCEID